MQVDPDAKIEDISVGMQQRVEILKVLYRGADILILDEPTAIADAAGDHRAYGDYFQSDQPTETLLF